MGWSHVITLVESHSYDVIFVPVGTNVMEEISFHHKCVVKSAKWDERQSLKCCRKKKNDTQKMSGTMLQTFHSDEEQLTL